jgi:hypothetical protein
MAEIWMFSQRYIWHHHAWRFSQNGKIVKFREENEEKRRILTAKIL